MKLIGIISLVASVAFVGVVFLNKEAHSAPARADSPSGLQVAPRQPDLAPAYAPPADTIDMAEADAPQALGCLIKPHTAADVGASAPGVLARMAVKRGDLVTRGQVLAVLDSDVEEALARAAEARASAKAEIAVARATYDMTRKKVERMNSLNKLSYGAKLELELARGEMEVAAHRVDQARERHQIASREYQVAQTQLDRRYVRSPIDGVVADRLVNVGERTDGQPIARVIRLDKLRVEIVAPARLYGRLTTGMQGQVSTETAQPISLKAAIDQVDAFIDPASSTFRAQMIVDNANLSIPAGARCHVSFDETAGRSGRS